MRDLTEREILLKKISTYEFAALDLQIYLDTHPHDTAMIQKMNGFKEKLKPLVDKQIFRGVLSLLNAKEKRPKLQCLRRFLSLVGEDGFEPSKRNATDLQSAPFGHSGILPYSFNLELVDGLEPPTC